MKYDALQRKVQEGTIHTKYDIQGNVIEVTNKQGTTYYTYDSFGNMLSSKDPNGNTVRYTYDDNHNIISKIYADTTITYTYTDYGQIESIQKDGNEVAHYRYNNQQEVMERTQGDIVTSKEYDANGNVIKQHTTQGNQVIFDATYIYDANQNLVEEVINGKTNTYDYNVFDELVSSKKYIDGELVETSYAFDLQGNQITSTSNGEYKKYTYNEANQVETIETEKGYIRYEYDDNGNIKQKQNEDYTKETYTYNEQDELTTLTQGQYVYTYAYDGEGNRIQQTKKDTHDYFYSVWYDYFVGVDVVSDQRVENAFDELRLQARRKEETGGTCTLKKQDFYDILYQKEPEITKYTLDRNTTYPEVLADDEVYVYGDSLLAHDDVQVIGGKNASVVAEVDGSTTKHYSYSDYGESTNPNRHAYNGEVQDKTGLIYLRARYYDPQTARFIQIDSHYAGEKQQVNSQNRYVYTLGNPYKYVDRDGKRAMVEIPPVQNGNLPYKFGMKKEWLDYPYKKFLSYIMRLPDYVRPKAVELWRYHQDIAKYTKPIAPTGFPTGQTNAGNTSKGNKDSNQEIKSGNLKVIDCLEGTMKPRTNYYEIQIYESIEIKNGSAHVFTYNSDAAAVESASRFRKIVFENIETIDFLATVIETAYTAKKKISTVEKLLKIIGIDDISPDGVSRFLTMNILNIDRAEIAKYIYQLVTLGQSRYVSVVNETVIYRTGVILYDKEQKMKRPFSEIEKARKAIYTHTTYEIRNLINFALLGEKLKIKGGGKGILYEDIDEDFETNKLAIQTAKTYDTREETGTLRFGLDYHEHNSSNDKLIDTYHVTT